MDRPEPSAPDHPLDPLDPVDPAGAVDPDAVPVDPALTAADPADRTVPPVDPLAAADQAVDLVGLHHPVDPHAAVPLPPDQVSPDLPASPVDRFDAAVDRLWGQAFRGRPVVDKVFYLASDLGDFSLIWHLIGTAQGLRSERDADATLRLAGVLLVESLVVNQGIKRLFRRPRPLATTPRPHHLRRPVTSSFPSGHASSAFTAAGVLSAHDPKLAPAYYGVAAVVATSRIHVRIHHASDVIAGAALGMLFAKAAVRLWPLPPR